MNGKARVDELARELRVPVKDVLSRLNAQGVIVRSGSSTVSVRVARWLRDSYRLRGEVKPASSAAAQESALNRQRSQPQKSARARGRPRKRSNKRRWLSNERITEPGRREWVPDPEVLRKLLEQGGGFGRSRPKTEAEKASDDSARERMRSHKPSTWKLGRSPGSYR